MRHGVDGRKFGRNTPHRKAMFKNLANSLIDKEQVITTVHKAKEVRRVVDRLITLAKDGSQHARRLAFDRTQDRDVVAKLFDTLAERYKERKGGYTRLVRISKTRRGDAAEMALFELVDHPPINRKKVKEAEGDAKAKEASTTEAQTVAAESADPYAGLRKSFVGSKKRQRAVRKGKSPDSVGKK